MDHADGEAPVYLWTPEPTGWKSRCLYGGAQHFCWREHFQLQHSIFLLNWLCPLPVFIILFCFAFLSGPCGRMMGRFLTCSSSSQSEFHFLSDHCWLDKPLRNQTKDKNNGLSDYSHTDLHYLNWFSHLGGCQQGWAFPTKPWTQHTNTGDRADSIWRRLDVNDTRCAFDVCFACSLNVETSETGSFKWALLVSPWWWRLKVVGFETFRSQDQWCFWFMKEVERLRRGMRFSLISKSN